MATPTSKRASATVHPIGAPEEPAPRVQAPPFAVGAVVRLNSGSAPLTVVGCYRDYHNIPHVEVMISAFSPSRTFERRVLPAALFHLDGETDAAGDDEIPG